MPELSKIQIRAEVLSVLSKYRNLKNPSSEQIAHDIEELYKIDDKDQVAKILFKEISLNQLSDYTNICAIMLLDVIENDIFEKFALDFLKNNNNSDEKKFFVISLVRQKGIYFDYNSIENYIENPDAVMQDSTKGFLMNVLSDPEVQIDLLDFYLNIPDDERIFLLNNLSKESDDNSVAYAIGIIAQLDVGEDESDIIINTLLKVDTPFAVEGLEYILKNYKIDLKKRQKVQKKLKELKNKYPDFNNDLITENTKINNCYISFTDGNSNFALILSRKHKDGLIDSIFLTVNVTCGILACMGFGCITDSNYKTILTRLFPDTIPVKINPIALKAIYKHHLDLNKNTNTKIPYELIVWSKLFNDIEDINYDFKEFIVSKLDSINLNEDKIKKFFFMKPNERWFFEYGQNETIDKIIEEIKEKHILEYNEIEKIILNYIDKDFMENKEFMDDITERLTMQAYILQLASLKMLSKTAYSLCFKDKHFKIFVKSLIYKSIYQYFLDLKEELSKQDNIFRKGKTYSFNNDEIDILITQIEEKWK